MRALAIVFVWATAATAYAEAPRLARGFAGSGVSGGTAALGGACKGHYPIVPQHQIVVENGEGPYRIVLDTVAQGVRLAVRDPHGELHCSPYQVELTVPGTYSVYVGQDEAQLGYAYDLRVRDTSEETTHYEMVTGADGQPHKVLVIDDVISVSGGGEFDGVEGPRPVTAPAARGLADVAMTVTRSTVPVLAFRDLISDARIQQQSLATLGDAFSIGDLRGNRTSPTVPIAGCDGRYGSRPVAHVVVGPDDHANLHVSVGRDTALLVLGGAHVNIAIRDPHGSVRCGDMGASVVVPAPGTYDVFVGMADDSPSVYSIRASAELPPPAVATAPAPATTEELPRPKPTRAKAKKGSSAPKRAKRENTEPKPMASIGTSTPLVPVLQLVQPELSVGRGTDEVARNRRADALRAILRLTVGHSFLCTGTLVVDHGETMVLTAAHCLYQLDGTGRLGERRTEMRAEELPSLDVSRAVLPTSFAACAERHVRYVECIGEHVSDVALVPFAQAVTTRRPAYSLCDAAPAQADITSFGYGLDRRGQVGSLVAAGFQLQRRPPEGPWVAAGILDHRVLWGDSGGPVITAEDDDELGSRSPHVCFVTAGVLTGDPDDPTATGIHALFQPTWGLSQDR